MPKVTPHVAFNVVSPDSVAECWYNVPVSLYNKIWNEIVPLYDGKPRSEYNDDYEDRCVSKFWDKFTVEEQKLLNKMAVIAMEDELYV